MVNPGWPYPGDSPVVRARRVALAYRARLAELDEPACTALDELCRQWGQGWAVVHLLTFDWEDWLTPRQAAELASVQVRHIAKLRRNGRLNGRRNEGRWEYQAGEVLAALSLTVRSHRKRT